MNLLDLDSKYILYSGKSYLIKKEDEKIVII